MFSSKHLPWQMAPSPALYAEGMAGAARALPNQAATEARFATGWTVGEWASLAAQVLAQAEGAADRPGVPENLSEGHDPSSALSWRAVRWAEGWLAWLLPAPGSADADDLAPPEFSHDLAERLEVAQEFGRLGVWERDAHTGQGRWDRHTFRLFGLPEGGAAPGFDATNSVIHADDRERVRLVYQSSLEQPGRYEAHFRVVRASGDVMRVRSTWRVEAGTASRPARAIGILVDETEHLAAMQRHALALQQLNLAGGLVGITLWRLDLATQRVQFNTVGGAFGAFRPPPEGMPADQVRAGIHPDDREAADRAAAQALNSDVAIDLRVRFRDREGRYRDLLTRRVAQRDDRGEPIALIGVSMDMTQQVADRARGDAYLARMQLVAEGTGIGIWSFDLDTQERYWNGRMRQLFGVAEGAPLPGLRHSLEQVVVPEDRPRMSAIVRLIERASARAMGRVDGSASEKAQAPANGEVLEVEFRIQRPPGPMRWLVSRTQLLNQGAQAIAQGVLIDVTDFRATQVELKLANRRVELAAQNL